MTVIVLTGCETLVEDVLDGSAMSAEAGPVDARPPDADPIDAARDAMASDGMMASDMASDTASDMTSFDAMPDAMVIDAAPDMAPPDAGPPDATPPAEDSVAYCDCMFLSCHDLYHLLWDEDEAVARARCFAVAEALPRQPDALEGDNLNCRRHWCDVSYAEDDPSLCDRAGGLAVCR